MPRGDVAEEDVDVRVCASSEGSPVIASNEKAVGIASGGALSGRITGLVGSSGPVAEIAAMSGPTVDDFPSAPVEVVSSGFRACFADTATVDDMIALRCGLWSEQLRSNLVGTEALKKRLEYTTVSSLLITASVYKVEAVAIRLIQFGVSVLKRLNNFKEYDAEEWELASLEDLERDGSSSREQVIAKADN